MAFKKTKAEGKGFGAVAAKLKETPIEQPTAKDDFEPSISPEVLTELHVGDVIQRENYVVKIVAFEAGHKGMSCIRYKKGFLDESGKVNYGPDCLGNKENIEKWLLGGKE